MKLLRLKINSDFRSLKTGFELNFRPTFLKEEFLNEIRTLKKFEPFCFAGLNGSGKSNVLEALANIFYHLELCANRFKPDAFEFFSPGTNINGPHAFELEYIIFKEDLKDVLDGLNIIRIVKKEGKEPKMYLKRDLFSPDAIDQEIQIVATSFDKAAPGKIYLPDVIVGYSSGENETLSIPFIKSRLIHYDEYAQSTVRNERFEKPESSLVYIDNEMSQAVLLSSLIFESDQTLKSLKEELNIVRLRSFRITLQNHILKVLEKNQVKKYPVIHQLNNKIEALKKISTAHFFHKFEKDEEMEESREYYKLTLDFFLDNQMKAAFRNVFKSSLDMFQFFQLLYELNNNFIEVANIRGGIKEEVYKSAGYYTDGKLPIPGPADKVFFFEDFYIEKRKINSEETFELLLKQFSDGEHQFLHTMGICLILKDKRSLILLDEPETHFNPDWRSRFIDMLENSLEESGADHLMKDILLTSHSPFIISDCLPNNVIFFDKKDDSKFSVAKSASELGLKTFGSSINYILKNFFNTDLIPKKSKDELIDLIENGSLEELREAVEYFGESSEKQFLFRRIYELTEEMDNDSTASEN
ncbi:hypothetical protein A8B79_05965 [Balneola sp. EhC07]|uniref:restriction system-associated AAA family ATPase n=1 Tax=Balneola sp. EhC07 TaxID=1849360 RepID=UPI0007F3F6E3|nr:restriction system-associated AAA family ATPase [Balneola sp. EhC07]OAN61019.1 hypothetical protein A8B79_05965 [Balneola sp. EhC07]